MKAWTPLILLIALTGAILLNNRETKPVVSVQPAPPETRAVDAKPIVKREAPVVDEQEDSPEDEVAQQATPVSIAQPEAPLQPQPPEPALPIWNIPKPKPANDMWTLRETVSADMSDRTVLLITYGKIPRVNFRVEPWEPNIFISDQR